MKGGRVTGETEGGRERLRETENKKLKQTTGEAESEARSKRL